MSRSSSNQVSPSFVVDQSSLTRGHGRQVDFAAVSDKYRQDAIKIKATANAAAAATTIAVEALDGRIPKGALLNFGGSKFAKLTAEADEGDVSLTVQALDNQVDLDDVTYFGVGFKVVPAGTIVADTTGGAVPREDSGADTANGIMETSQHEDPKAQDSLSGGSVLNGGVLFKNQLPQVIDAEISSGTIDGWITELKNAGCHFNFDNDYVDSSSA